MNRKPTLVFALVLALVLGSVFPAGAVPAAQQATPIPLLNNMQQSGQITGNPAGSFNYYRIDYPGGGDVVTITMDVAVDNVYRPSIGFNVYGPLGELVAHGTSLGTPGRIEAEASEPDEGEWLVQVFNYAGGLTVSYTIMAEGLPQPTPTPAPPTPTPAQGTAQEPTPMPTAAEEVAPADWPMANLDYGNTRAAVGSSITSENVDELGVAWTFLIPGAGAYGSAASNPLIADGVVYFQDLGSNVFALNLEDGSLIWEARYDHPAVGPNGPALTEDKVIAHGSVNMIRAFDRETGEVLWETELDGPTGAQQPYVYDGIVYTGTAAGAVNLDTEGIAIRGYAGGASGHIYALDEETGEVIWQFQTVEEGFWGNPEVNSGGGIWYPPAVDTETGNTFWATGNPAPFPGTADFPNASSRPGPNLYSNSVLAFDPEGELLWATQLKPHDLFDHDAQVPRILTTATIDGQERDIVIASGKLGRVVALDRETGEILWDVEVGEHQNDQLEELPLGETVTVLPGVYGGVETPMTYADGVLYVPVIDIPTPFSATGFDAADGGEAVANAEGRTDVNSGTGSMLAMDVDTGEILWTTDLGAPPIFGGATLVNDLVFTSQFGGRVTALSIDDGETVWSRQFSAGINAWPAVYDDTIIIPAGLGDTPVLMALRLGAQGGPMQTPPDLTYRKSPWWPYLSNHVNDDSPPDIIGGPLVFTITQESGAANWALPGPRELDPTIFGTEDNPMATEEPPIILGVPMPLRDVQEDGSFITNVATPFGDDYASTEGSFELYLTDATATDGATTKDTIDLVATFQAPGDGGTYRVEVTQAAPHGWFIPTAGGVATNYIQHGLTKWGTQLMPTQFVYAGFWGMGDLYLDDELVAEGRLVHGMLTEYVRNEDYELVFDNRVNPNARHFHIILPPFTPTGEASPVTTGFTLPNDMEQPFLHVMFPEVTVSGGAMAGEMAGEAEPTPAPTGEEEPRTIEVIARNYEFEPSTIEVQVGEPVRFVVRTVDIYHTFTVKENEDATENMFNLQLFPDQGPQEQVWTFEEAGSYYLYCIPHEGLGMVGSIEVTE